MTKKIVDKLKKQKYLSNEFKVINSFLNVYPSYYNDQETLKNIDTASEGRINFLRSTDLIYGLSKQREKWEELFFTNTK